MPFVFVQAMVLKNKIPRLSLPSDLPFGKIDGKESSIGILVLGESPVAGYGLESHSASFAACLANCLSKKGRAIFWKTCGWVGIDMLALSQQPWPQEEFALVFVAMGVNDIKNFSSVRYWRRGIEAVVDKIRTEYPKAWIVFSETPPIAQFPALSSLLSLVLGWRRDILQSALEEELARKKVLLLSFDLKMERRFFAEDHFHPSALAHECWAKAVAEQIAPRLDSILANR